MEAQIFTALLALGVPYVTELLKRTYSLFSANAPESITKLKPLVAGVALTYLSKKTGMPIPDNLVNLTTDPTVNMVSTGILFGAVGHWLSSFSAGLKSHIPSTTAIGKFLSIFLGKY